LITCRVGVEGGEARAMRSVSKKSVGEREVHTAKKRHARGEITRGRRTSATVASTSRVSEVVMVWRTMGCSEPSLTSPTVTVLRRKRGRDVSRGRRALPYARDDDDGCSARLLRLLWISHMSRGRSRVVARSRDRAPPLASPSRVPGGAADGLVVGLAVESLGEERLGVDRRGDILDLVFRGRRAHGRASRLGGALRLGLPLRGRRAELRGEGGTESRHGVRWWCHARGAREAGRVAGWRVECAYATPGAWLSWRAVSLKRSQTVDFVRDRLSIQSEIPNR
jgi:hypothetical protein